MKKNICFVSIIGRPNVGKSTLLNNILNYEVSIVSPISQTTRDQIIGIYTKDNYQIVFTDTPGIHKKKNELGETLNKKAWDTIKENDLILFLQPANEEILKGDKFIIETIKNIKTKKMAILTKIDLIKNPSIIKEKQDFFLENNFIDVLTTSNKNIKSINYLIEEIKKHTYEDIFYYDEFDITDKSISFMSKEIIRESAISFLEEELPHSIVIEINNFSESDIISISANIITSKESQKPIIIGKGGKMIKQIGIKARKNIEESFGKKVNLSLKVVVDKNWKTNIKKIKKYGY